jgi:hypothetical protein
MSDEELDQKFMSQCEMVYDPRSSRCLLDLLRGLEKEADAGSAISAMLH